MFINKLNNSFNNSVNNKAGVWMWSGASIAHMAPVREGERERGFNSHPDPMALSDLSSPFFQPTDFKNDFINL